MSPLPSHIDYCATLLISSSKVVTNKLQRMMNAAARIIPNTQKFDHDLTQLTRHELHWLEVAERVKFCTAPLIYRCLHGQAPSYLVNLCKPTTLRNSRYLLGSNKSNQRIILFARRTGLGARAFSVVGPALWNPLPDYLRFTALTLSTFLCHLKTFLFALYH